MQGESWWNRCWALHMQAWLGISGRGDGANFATMRFPASHTVLTSAPDTLLACIRRQRLPAWAGEIQEDKPLLSYTRGIHHDPRQPQRFVPRVHRQQ